MALTSGTKLGPYEIQSPLGAGGMGEVYRARDTRLDRSVAIKVLPAHLSVSSDAKHRLEREARAISSLNHPNICTLHDVGHQDGIDYLVMEFLEGETLADRLMKGPTAARASAEVRNRNLRRPGEGSPQRYGAPRPEARQHHAHQDRGQADGLRTGQGHPSASPASFGAYGHYRDLRGSQPLPLRERWWERSSTCRRSKWKAKRPTRAATYLRFGAVLYEMATGKRAFEGKTTASVVAAVLAAEPSRSQPCSRWRRRRWTGS